MINNFIGGLYLYTKKKTPSKAKAKESIEKALNCLKEIPAKECTENANRKIDEALAYCYVTKDNL
jgi:hypothetical protein